MLCHRLTLPHHVIHETRPPLCRREAGSREPSLDLKPATQTREQRAAMQGVEEEGHLPATSSRVNTQRLLQTQEPKTGESEAPLRMLLVEPHLPSSLLILIASAHRWHDPAHLTEEEAASSERPGHLSQARQLRSAGRSMPVSTWPEAALSPAHL